LDDNTRTVFISGIAAFVTVATAYIAARWQITRQVRKDSQKKDDQTQ